MDKPKRWLGLDIGGANLKAATADGYAREVSFPLWKQPEQLADAIADLIRDAPPCRGFGVTMTGELADCYASKAEGVEAIVTAVEQATDGRETRYYSQNHAVGQTLSAAVAVEDWRAVAAANFHALATACRWAPQLEGDLLVDVGSTTTDVALTRGPHAKNDTDRLLAGELIYQGVGRTPICAVVETLPYRGQNCPVAAELFATTADVALLLGYAEPSDDSDTADGRPFTELHAVLRLGRMICADDTQFNVDDAMAAAKAVCERLERRLVGAVERAVRRSNQPVDRIIVSGSGAWLARATLSRIGYVDNVVKLADVIGEEPSKCAPAWAVATLFDEWSRA